MSKLTARLLGLCLGFAAIGAAHADKVGVAAAVNPDAFSSLSGSPQTQLNIGKSIFFSERINTTGSGLVQVLLVDGSTFTVGPGSDLVIDKFVYDPNKKSGEVVASFSKGVMRFVGGKISKNEGGVTVNTPSGALAIRGGMFQTNGKVYSFLFGENMTLTGRNGQQYTVFQPGNSIDTSGGTPTIRPTTAADINSVMVQLTNGNTGGANPTNTQGPPQQKLVETLSLQDLINEATDTQINGDINSQEKQDVTQTTETTTPTGTPGTPTGTPGTPETPQSIPINARVLTPPNSFTAFGTDYPDPSGGGILGGDKDPDVNVDDFIWTFDLGTGHFKGTVTGLNDGSGDFKPGTIDFPFVGLTGQNDVFPINLTDNATLTEPGQVTKYSGYVVVRPGFFAYDVVNASNPGSGDSPDRLLAFGGQGYNFGTPSAKIYSFNLTPDTIETGAFGPFASTNSSPVPSAFTGLSSYDAGGVSQGIGFVSPLLLLEQDNGGAGDQSHAVWLQTNFFVGDGANKGSSFINVALGEWSAQGGIAGFRRGGSIVLGPNQTYSFSGNIASLAGPDSNGTLSQFMGSANPNIVIGADTTGTGDHTIFRDTPLNPTEDKNTPQEQSGATYHVGIGQLADIQPTQTPGTKITNGFAAGFAQHPDTGSSDIVANFSPSDVTLKFNATTNTLETNSFKLKDIKPSGLGAIQALLNLSPQFDLGFGGNGRSAFIDDNTFAAVEKGGSTVEVPGLLGTKTYAASVQGFIVSADAIAANEVLFGADPETGAPNKQAFCQNCTFMKWGAWGARVEQTTKTATADVPLGWWIAGDVVSKKDMPTTAIASYAGDAIGNVNNNGQQYVATGDMNMKWYFADRAGTLKISNFDNKNFVFGIGADRSTPQQFNGILAPGSGFIGAANGAFVGANRINGVALAPQGVIGNFGVANSGYQATGIFGGTHVGN